MAKKFILIFTFVISLLSTTGFVFASPWDCLQNWVHDNQSELNNAGVKFAHIGTESIESYLFQPIKNNPSLYNKIVAATISCGCDGSEKVYPDKIIGLCGH